MTDKQTYILRPSPHPSRQLCVEAVRNAPDGMMVTIREQTRNLEQSAKFHAICGDLSKSDVEWMGKKRTLEQWKVLLISGHAIATGRPNEMIAGLEGEIVNIREESSKMSVSRMSSLIEYSLAFAIEHGVKLRDTV